MIRSLLYVPADSERFIAKAHERHADAIILDLEDSVAPENKAAARAGLGRSVASVGQGGAKVFVRVNSSDDLQLADAVAACRAGATGLVVPKVQQPQDLDDLAHPLSRIEAEMNRPALQFIALIEDPGAVLNAAAIASAPRLLGLATGGEDLALALGARPTPAVLHLPKLLVHYAAKAKGLLSLGLLRSVADYSDLDAIVAAIQEAREHGFDGATCVHPTIVPLLNAGFFPSAEEIDWATRVLSIAEHQIGSFAMDGQMIDEPVIARARNIARRARAFVA
ncbi:MAG: HpcH/HpaI aldolase/citrate lyase family protein [Cypionkella sp.]